MKLRYFFEKSKSFLSPKKVNIFDHIMETSSVILNSHAGGGQNHSSFMSPFIMEAKGYSSATAVGSNGSSKNQRSLLTIATDKYVGTRTSRMSQFNQFGELTLVVLIFIAALVMGTVKACLVTAPGGASLSTEQRFGIFYNYFGIIFIAGVTAVNIWACGMERLAESIAPLVVAIFYFVYYRSVYMSSTVGDEWFNDYYNLYVSAVVWVFASLATPLLTWPTYDVNKITLGMVSPNKNMVLITGMLALLVSGGVSLKGNPPVPYM